jgi:hypothetical protein
MVNERRDGPVGDTTRPERRRGRPAVCAEERACFFHQLCLPPGTSHRVFFSSSSVHYRMDYADSELTYSLAPTSTELKHHFKVSNSYVIRKLQLVVFPWKHRSWTRKILRAADAGQGDVAAWVPLREDINSPDWCIPSEFPHHISSSTMEGKEGTEADGTKAWRS